MHLELKKEDLRYPKSLKDVFEAPDKLYVKCAGVNDFEQDIFDLCVGIVGSRDATRYGLKAVDMIVSGLSRFGVTIVSGFMHGVDIAAHRAALKYGTRTIAVMPCGIDGILPKKYESEHSQIVKEGGLIMSEYPPGTDARKWTFVQRNRIIAGLSHGVIVIEAAKKSGSLITSDYALSFGREVFALPGSVFSKNSQGTNNLIKNGATVVRNAQDILQEFGLLNIPAMVANEKPSKIYNLSTQEATILDYLSMDALNYGELLTITGYEMKSLTSFLTHLELNGLINYEGGYYYVS